MKEAFKKLKGFLACGLLTLLAILTGASSGVLMADASNLPDA